MAEPASLRFLAREPSLLPEWFSNTAWNLQLGSRDEKVNEYELTVLSV